VYRAGIRLAMICKKSILNSGWYHEVYDDLIPPTQKNQDATAPYLVPGTNGTVRLGSERKFSSGTWKIFVILPRALAIDDDFKNLLWLKFRTFLASAN
jgi:hypothetical protein